MKNFFNLMLAFAATMLLASSCNKEPQNEPVQDNVLNFTATTFAGGHFIYGGQNQYMVMLSDEGEVHNYMFNLYNQLGEIDENGFVTIPSGTYTCAEGQEDYTIAPSSLYIEQSENGESPKMIDINELTVVISDDKLVLTAVVEGVTHVVTYNGAVAVKATLPDPDVDFEANYAYAFYTDKTSAEDVAYFKLFLSDIGHNGNGDILPNGTYYELVLAVNRLDPNAKITIPAGRYEIGDTDSETGYIVGAEYYKFGESVLMTEDHDFIRVGNLTVNEDGSMEASLDMYFGGATHNVSFSGEVEILENTIPAEAPYSKLASDKECDLSNHTLDIWYEGDAYGAGYHVWGITITSNDRVGDNICFEILRGTDRDADLSGKYTVNQSMEDFTVIPGNVDGFTLMASWYYYKTSYMYISEFAPVVDGWVEIQVTDKEVYTISFDVYDDLNNNITGTFTYEIPTV